MIGSIIGLLVMIALTTFMAALMQLSAEVLAPKKILTSSQKAVIFQYWRGLPAPPAVADPKPACMYIEPVPWFTSGM